MQFTFSAGLWNEYPGAVLTARIWSIFKNICNEIIAIVKVTSTTKRSLLKICHLRQRLKIFLFHRKIMLHEEDTQAFVFLIIP